jgi:hypothetical protein
MQGTGAVSSVLYFDWHQWNGVATFIIPGYSGTRDGVSRFPQSEGQRGSLKRVQLLVNGCPDYRFIWARLIPRLFLVR